MNRREFLQAGLGSAAAMSTATRVNAQIDEFDYIIVGAGSSGCVAAHRLSADASVRVLLIEAGGSDDGDPALTIPGRWVSLIGSRWDWGYRTEPEPGLDNRRIAFPRGKLLGGSSAINAMTFIRGHVLDFDGWRDQGNPGWGFADLQPCFKRSEDNSRGASEYHGTGGPLAVSDTPDAHAAHEAFLAAAELSGYQARPDWDFNARQQENGAGYYQKNIRDGRRRNAAAAFLVPARTRPNLVVRSHSHASRLLIHRRRVIGVEYIRGRKLERAHASRDVILCGGAIDSPKLLLLSGIGPASHLRALGIPVVADLPGVGANLQDHLRISVRWQGRQTLPPSTTTAGLFVRTARAGATETPDLHFYLGRGTDQPDPMVTITVALGRPHSRGEVRLSSTNPLDPPIIRAHYLRVPADVAALTAGVKLIRTLGNSRPFQPLVSGESEPGSDVRTDDEIASFIRRGADTIFHAAASCPMGTDRMAVVDSSLRVHGLEGVRVADASIMPNVVNAPTHAACIMIGERLADLCRT